MVRDTQLILCPVNLRHVKLDCSAYEEAVAMAIRRDAKLLVATIAPEMERNLNIQDSVGYWTEKLNAFVAAHRPNGVEIETCVRTGAVHRQIVKLGHELGAAIAIICR